MIEKLKNCPNCAGILDDVGRCKYCGSKVYDFLTLDFSPQGATSGEKAQTYIRIRFNGKECLLPIMAFESATITSTPNYSIWEDFDSTIYRSLHSIDHKVEISCYCGDLIVMEKIDTPHG